VLVVITKTSGVLKDIQDIQIARIWYLLRENHDIASRIESILSKEGNVSDDDLVGEFIRLSKQPPVTKAIMM
jgi:hypothetical protein